MTVRFVPMVFVAVHATLAPLACQQPAGHVPVARITATPRTIPEHDGFQTDVVLSGTTSADPVDDPDGGSPLSYQWEIIGDEARLQTGMYTSPELTVRFLGTRPATIVLTVTDADGQSATAHIQMQLTL
jgi:hypothetical protein